MKYQRQFCRVLRPITGRGLDDRRLSAARRALQREANDVALFPELQPTETPELRIARLDAEVRVYFQQLRDHTAATWRRARRTFRTLTTEQRKQVLARWNAPTWHPPHKAHYLADLIHITNHP